MAHRFKIKGTKDFLVMAVFCAFLCIWSIKDAWFPSPKVLKKHPQEIEAAFTLSGTVTEVGVRVGNEIHGRVLLAKIGDTKYKKLVGEAEEAFESAKRSGETAQAETKLEALKIARDNLMACSLYNTDLLRKESHGETIALKGKVLRVLVKPGDSVEAGDPILVVNPGDSFYGFNQVLAVLTGIGFIVAMILHVFAAR